MDQNTVNSPLVEKIEGGRGSTVLHEVDEHEPVEENLAEVREKLSHDRFYLFDSLTNKQIWAYGVGHFNNDLTCGIWFNYLLYYLTTVLEIGGKENADGYAALVMLAGQIADGSFTPIAGILSDRSKSRWGKRKPWYVGGTIVVAISFLLLYQPCLTCGFVETENAKKYMTLAWYTTWASLFNAGWAFACIAHISLVPSLTSSRSRRDTLNNLRNTFTYVANFAILLIALFLFSVVKSPTAQFELLAWVVSALGLFHCGVFIIGINEVKLVAQCKMKLKAIANNSNLESLVDQSDFVGVGNRIRASIVKAEETDQKDSMDGTSELELSFDENDQKIKRQMTGSLAEKEMQWYEWFKEFQFYIYMVVYTCAKITVNSGVSMIPFYLVSVLKIGGGKTETSPQLASIPIVMYAASVFASLSLNRMYQVLGKKLVYTTGLTFMLLSCTVLFLLNVNTYTYVYPTIIFFGIGSSVCMNTAVNFVSDVIGLRGNSGAFVFGFYSLVEKFINGIILFVLMDSKLFKDRNETLLRWCMAAIPAVAATLGGIITMFGKTATPKDGKGSTAAH